jgi:hypothetical protein
MKTADICTPSTPVRRNDGGSCDPVGVLCSEATARTHLLDMVESVVDGWKKRKEDEIAGKGRWRMRIFVGQAGVLRSRGCAKYALVAYAWVFDDRDPRHPVLSIKTQKKRHLCDSNTRGQSPTAGCLIAGDPVNHSGKVTCAESAAVPPSSAMRCSNSVWSPAPGALLNPGKGAFIKKDGSF